MWLFELKFIKIKCSEYLVFRYIGYILSVLQLQAVGGCRFGQYRLQIVFMIIERVLDIVGLYFYFYYMRACIYAELEGFFSGVIRRVTLFNSFS